MANLSEQEKRELLEDAACDNRRREFAALRDNIKRRRLTTAEYIEFLDWSQQFMSEDPKKRKPISGEKFLL